MLNNLIGGNIFVEAEHLNLLNRCYMKRRMLYEYKNVVDDDDDDVDRRMNKNEKKAIHEAHSCTAHAK